MMFKTWRQSYSITANFQTGPNKKESARPNHMCNVFSSISARNLPDVPAAKALYTSVASIFFSLRTPFISSPASDPFLHESATAEHPFTTPVERIRPYPPPFPARAVPIFALPRTLGRPSSHTHCCWLFLLLLCTRLFQRTDTRVIESDFVRIFVSIVFIWTRSTKGCRQE